MTSSTAQLKYLRMAPRKVRSVADLVRGLPVNDAEAQLMVQTRRPAKPLLKLLRSAISNAKNNKQNPDHLFIAEIRVDQGPMLKRYLPRARGSASPIQKKMSHVTLTLGVNEKLQPKYKIVVPKKSKLPPGEEGKPAKKRVPKKSEGGEKQPEQKKNPGFFQKVFRRKAGMGK
ncbi:MAG: 50S ribosomal protein L22 [Patescibacteria group bacterium]|nr:50S ribosomal protein L22 [Patescibacteria group bacterium]